MEGARTGRRYGRSSHSARVVVVLCTEPLVQEPFLGGQCGHRCGPEVVKALTKVDPTYRDHALTGLRDRLYKYRANELLGD